MGVPGQLGVITCWEEAVTLSIGQVSRDAGICAVKALDAAVRDLKEGYIDGLVTAPVNKESMAQAGFGFPGHTEYLTHAFGQSESLMFLVRDGLRVGLVTNHLPVNGVSALLTRGLVSRKIALMDTSLRQDFGLEKPSIAVLGFNPHAGDGGVLGSEEEDLIRPAITDARKNGVLAFGPFPADGFFGSGSYMRYDGILAIYHDQGLIPFKLLAFGGGTNFTAGLPVVRTSPDHGTAFEIAGKNEADPGSFREALFTCVDLVRCRSKYREDHAHPLRRRHKASIQNPASNEEEETIEDLD